MGGRRRWFAKHFRMRSKANLSKIPIYPGTQTVGDRPHADPSTVQGPKVRRLFAGERWIIEPSVKRPFFRYAAAAPGDA
jgi:hypothetical protein